MQTEVYLHETQGKPAFLVDTDYKSVACFRLMWAQPNNTAEITFFCSDVLGTLKQMRSALVEQIKLLELPEVHQHDTP